MADSRLLLAGLREAGAYLDSQGVKRPAHLVWALKARRDPKEPGKREKEAQQDKLALQFRRLFARQKQTVEARLGMLFPLKAYQLPFDVSVFADPEAEAEIMKILLFSTLNGVEMFQAAMTLQMDYTAVNSAAAKWAQKYAGELVKGVNQTTLEAIRQAVSTFVDTPGFTIGDVMRLLPFGEDRALMVAVTEITRAYATAQQLAGKEMQRQFPDVLVVKTWFTNNDDRVCDICGPLHGKVIEIDGGFTTEENTDEGIAYPPGHPGCRCWLSTRTKING